MIPTVEGVNSFTVFESEDGVFLWRYVFEKGY